MLELREAIEVKVEFDLGIQWMNLSPNRHLRSTCQDIGVTAQNRSTFNNCIFHHTMQKKQ